MNRSRKRALERAIETDWVLPNWSTRNWTRVGNIKSPREAIVDLRGLVTTWFDGWSLDWWIGAEDGWHVPSREAPSRVRQRLIAAAPVVETSLRVPGGHAVQRAYACYTGLGGDDESEMVIVEIENRSPVPVAVALAVRPYNPEGLSAIERIGLHDGTTVTVDGRVAMLLPRPPAQVAASTLQDGDSAQIVLADGARAGDIPPGFRDEAGMAQAAFVYPLPHTATLRAALPMVRGVERAPALPTAIPSADQVARGWAAQSRGGMRLVLPDPRLQEAVDANRRFLLALHDSGFAEAPFLLLALGRYGYSSQVGEILRSYPSRQVKDGCALWSIGEHWRLRRDRESLEPMVGAIAEGAHSVGRKRRTKSDTLWATAGLRSVAELLDAFGQPGPAALVRKDAEALWADTLVSLDRNASVASLVACEPLHLLAPDDHRIAAMLDVIGTDLDPHLAMRIAEVELAGGDRRALDRLAWLLDAATPTWTWSGHDGRAGASFLSFVRDLLVREVPAVRHDDDVRELALCSLLPDSWLGQGFEVHDAPTHVGSLSYAVRWHGARPALLWELAPHDDIAIVRLTAPGLDPAWSTVERTGEVLLSVPERGALSG